MFFWFTHSVLRHFVDMLHQFSCDCIVGRKHQALPEDGLVRRGHDDPLHRTVALAVLNRRYDLLHEGEREGVGRRPVEAEDGDAAGGVLLGRDEGRRVPALRGAVQVPGAATQN